MLASPPKIYDHLLRLIGVAGQVVHCAAGCKFLHLFPVCRFIIVGNKADNSVIVCELDDMIAVETDSTVICQQREQRTPNTPLCSQLLF